jgi:dethiobiotin synthetase
MIKGFFITGTDTGVGKTFVAAGLIRAMKNQGLSVCPMKPAETGCRVSKGQLVPEDTVKLMMASGVDEQIDTINPYRMQKPLAPSIAAELEGVCIEKRLIFNAYEKLARKYDVLIIEGAGGIMVPLYKKYLYLDLVRDIGLPLIIVARPGLGTVNHSLLTIEAARTKDIKVLGLIFNHTKKTKTDISQKTNPEIITQIGKVPVLGIIQYIPQSDKDKSNIKFKKISNKLISYLS